MQQAALGRALSETETQHLQRGDLIFWSGHVAIVRDAATIVHANAHHMATAVEPTEAALTRIAATGARLISIRRL
jgi:cell wall-associated NlpC family hydrolase